MKFKSLLIIGLINVSTGVFAQSIYEDRIVDKVELKHVDTINLTTNPDIEIFAVEGISISPDGKFAVTSEYEQTKFVKIDLETHKLNFFGGEKGKGPGEVLGVNSLVLDSLGVVYYADYNKGIIGKWHVEDGFLSETHRLGKGVSPHQITVCPNNDWIYLYSRSLTRNGLLHKYDKSFNKLNAFYTFSKDERSRDLHLPSAHFGRIDCDKHGNLYYGPNHIDGIKKFNPEGELIGEADIPGYEQTENLVVRDGRWMMINEEARKSTGQIHIVGNNLFASFSGRNKGKSWYAIIDVYDTSTMKYKYSIQFDFFFRWFDIAGSKLVILTEERESGDYILSVYNYQPILK